MPKADWEIWEEDVQEKLNLRKTVASGSKFYDIGDGTTAGNPNDQEAYPLLVDSKATIQKAYSVNRDFVDKWKKKSTEHGQSFALPVRFIKNSNSHSDWVFVPFEDYVELVRNYREHN